MPSPSFFYQYNIHVIFIVMILDFFVNWHAGQNHQKYKKRPRQMGGPEKISDVELL